MIVPSEFGSNVWGHFWLSQLEREEGTGIYWAEARMLLTILQYTGQAPCPKENYLTLNVNSAKSEKP